MLSGVRNDAPSGTFCNYLYYGWEKKCRSLRTPANILVMNLAISDFFMIAKMPIFIYNSIKLGPALGEIGCQIYGFLGGLTGTVSIATLAAIAMDRYFVIIYPLDPLKRTTKLRAGICVVLSWLYGAFFSSLPLFGINRYVPEGYLTSCSFDYLSNDYASRIFIIVFFFAAWVVPFIIISFSYANICIMVINARQGGARSASGSREQQRKTELKLALVVIAIIGLWFFAWTPYAIVALLGFSGQKEILLPLTSMVPALFCKIASCLDPFVYAVSHPRFRRELIRCFTRKRNSKGEQNIKSRAATAIAGVEMKKVVKKDLSYSCTEDEDDNMMMVELKMNNGCSGTTKSEPPRWARTDSNSSNNVWLTNSSKLKMSNKKNLKSPVSF